MPRKDGRPADPAADPAGSRGRPARGRPARGRPARAVAPWVRTRLRTAPGTAAAFALLVLVTAFLAAALPRTVDAYETEGLRHDIVSAKPSTTVLDITTAQPPADLPRQARAEEVSPARLAEKSTELRELLPAPLRVDPAQSAHGVRTTKRVTGLESWLPKPSGLPPEFTLTTLPELDRHATVREGRLPTRAEPGRTSEVAVTRETAKSLRLKVGSVVHVPELFAKEPLALTVVGIVEPRGPQGSYWSVDPLLRTPVYASKTTAGGTYFYWQAGLLLPPAGTTTILASNGEPEVYWRFAPDAGALTAQDEPRLTTALASLSGGPDLVRIRETVGGTGAVSTGLDEIVAAYGGMRSAIAPVVAVAAFGIGAVAAVVITMTGGLFAARRAAELALLRSRGGSLAGIGVRLLGETAVLALPAAALGLLLATLAFPEARFLPALAAAGAVALLATVALPLRALFLHRKPLAHGGREDLVAARPSRGRTVAELTVLALAVGAVAALRRRGTGDSGDYLVSSAPVLVALIAALVLVRLYPLPLRWAARPARRLRGAVGYLSLARAGRSSATGTLPLLALLVALTTAAFGGSVLAGVADARDRAALLETGADARVTGNADSVPLTDGLTTAVRRTAGVTDVATVQVEYGVALPDGTGQRPELRTTALVGVDPESYTRLAGRTGFGPFPADLLKPTGADGKAGGKRILPAIASPAIAERLGTEPRDLEAAAGEFAVRIVAVRNSTPALPEQDFLLVDGADLPRGEDTVLLASGPAMDGTALRKVVAAKSPDFSVVLRTERRATYVDSPMQAGAERIYLAAIGAGAGYAVLALLLSLMQSAPERATLLARLRTMGLTRREGRRLLGLEALPQALLAAVGGTLVGWATILLLAPGVDLVRLSLAAPPGTATLDSAPLRADLWSLALPAAGVVVLAALAAALQAWWSARTGSIKELRAGDAR
ncbi:ABC transporter permease [Streptomyces sp. P9(2023)]|uniref:FtsX-like permease family protein n=1 Tax=Streptomyces sp. P9(2023) TaxID=3064394 RepID=UPI0028F43D16|nr:FtsX-like permease family protein [Streptomyces sp. P9(2023)]MDT9690289.1 ABC transporter permease [Streptomyces sp. P9(2023)]